MRGFTGFFGSVLMGGDSILTGSVVRGEEVRPAESAASTSASSKASGEMAELRQQFLMIYAKVLYSDPISCVDDCTVPIKLTWTTMVTRPIALQQLPKKSLSNTISSGKKQQITCMPDHTPDLNGRKIEFDETHGIFFVPNGKTPIDDPKQKSQDKFEVTNVHSKITKVTYLPLVLWWTADDPQPEMCAAGDPIINNK